MAVFLPAGMYDQFPPSLELKLTKPLHSEDATKWWNKDPSLTKRKEEKN